MSFVFKWEQKYVVKLISIQYANYHTYSDWWRRTFYFQTHSSYLIVTFILWICAPLFHYHSGYLIATLCAMYLQGTTSSDKQVHDVSTLLVVIARHLLPYSMKSNRPDASMWQLNTENETEKCTSTLRTLIILADRISL